MSFLDDLTMDFTMDLRGGIRDFQLPRGRNFYAETWPWFLAISGDPKQHQEMGLFEHRGHQNLNVYHNLNGHFIG